MFAEAQPPPSLGHVERVVERNEQDVDRIEDQSKWNRDKTKESEPHYFPSVKRICCLQPLAAKDV